MFSITSRRVLTSASTAASASTRALVRPQSMGVAHLQMQTRSNWNLSAGLPNLKGMNGQTTLGELWERAYVKYQYRLMYPIAAWVGFLWYNLWVPYAPKAEKAEAKARMDYLKSLEYHQSP
ncbi:hypothetical protein BASA50_011061 [Batrachochytrium salamandrivorans]|uniref:Uncharacterized protein n=1 Tax=Batrachochytrium salamandrivorans TaxID=1357716 RepID=A0ABQ8EWN6_9FUNG|nr:hypothetical protein BASA62_006937 [Batrachochytrium salamandrivorans]KAH6577518.1 hypothetical protein BASA60_004000 [Batrachochytrium salamandrivorans]KAH6581857.1 hypothetical protein BASA61_008865 [Batrachochytrium salamandrivorans]KAH6587869.1 hypothetical protein BASA50_011061 [Batrachochytrium salamandrivorans]KAH9265327.1 hypothetical protein BASA83_011138 [Batrachochytrium salamandrivorans]